MIDHERALELAATASTRAVDRRRRGPDGAPRELRSAGRSARPAADAVALVGLQRRTPPGTSAGGYRAASAGSAGRGERAGHGRLCRAGHRAAPARRATPPPVAAAPSSSRSSAGAHRRTAIGRGSRSRPRTHPPTRLRQLRRPGDRADKPPAPRPDLGRRNPGRGRRASRGGSSTSLSAAAASRARRPASWRARTGAGPGADATTNRRPRRLTPPAPHPGAVYQSRSAATRATRRGAPGPAALRIGQRARDQSSDGRSPRHRGRRSGGVIDAAAHRASTNGRRSSSTTAGLRPDKLERRRSTRSPSAAASPSDDGESSRPIPLPVETCGGPRTEATSGLQDLFNRRRRSGRSVG